VPPEALTAPLAAHIVSREEIAEDASVRQPANAVALFGELRYLETPRPRALIAIAYVDGRTRGKGGPRVQIECPPPSAHPPIVLTPAVPR